MVTIIITIMTLAVIMLIAVILIKALGGDTSNLTITNQDYSLRKSIMTPTELNFYNDLEVAVQDRYIICPKVRVIDFVEPIGKNKNSNFNRIVSKHCDFLLCSRSFKPIFVIELDDKSHNNVRSQKNDNFKNELYQTIGIKLIRIKVSSIYNIKDIQEKLILN